MKKLFTVLGIIVLVSVLAVGAIAGKVIIDNGGYRGSRLEAVVTKWFGKTAINEATAAPVAPVATATMSSTTVAPTGTAAVEASEMNFSEFILLAQQNEYGALNGTYSAEAETVSLTGKEEIIGKKVYFQTDGNKFSVFVGEEMSAGSSAKKNVKLSLCEEHKALRSFSIKIGTKVSITMDEEKVTALAAVACRWLDADGKWVYGVRICEHTGSGSSSGGGGDAHDPTTPPTPTPTPTPIPTEDPVVPPVDPDPELPQVEEEEEKPTAKPSHAPQEEAHEEAASSDQQQELDDGEEYWESDDTPSSSSSSPAHAEQQDDDSTSESQDPDPVIPAVQASASAEAEPVLAAVTQESESKTSSDPEPVLASVSSTSSEQSADSDIQSTLDAGESFEEW